MMREPKAVKEIHDIRLQMYEDYKDLSLKERMEKIKEGARIEWKRIFGDEKEAE